MGKLTYKGFDSSLKCRGFQYQVGETYEHEGEVKTCSGGFHACEYPLDVFGYYPPSGSRFAEVEQDGEISSYGGDSKVASKRITIKAEISIAGLINAALDYTFSRVKPVDPNSPASNSGTQGVAASFGADSKAMSSETGAIVCVYRNDDGELMHIKASKVGENGIKPDTWYTLDESGEFVEVEA